MKRFEDEGDTEIRRVPAVAAGVLVGAALMAGFGPGVAGASQPALSGCERAGTVGGLANYRCEIYTSGSAPTQDPATLVVVGHLPHGTNGFYCQYQDPAHPIYLPNGAKNNWWALPSSSAYDGWLNVVYLSGGANFRPEPGLPQC